MKKIETWQCDKCGMTHYTYESCKQCEESHITPIAFIYKYKCDSGYFSETENNMYPSRILAKFKNGVVKAYTISTTTIFDKEENFDVQEE